jgi:type II secretory pathway predicted ATPase ExeA
MSRKIIETMQKPNLKPFPYADYAEAKKMLKSALDGPCFYGMLTGASGTGKTLLLRDITESLDRHRYHVVYLSSSKISLFSIVRFLATRLRVGARCSHLETLDVLAQTIYEQAAHTVLWLDEADQLNLETLQEIRSLAEHRLAQEQLLTVLFAGLPELSKKLEVPSLFPLKRRISCRCTLTGLRRAELDAFLEHRFGFQEAQRLASSVRDELFERTLAAPALIDQVVRHAFAKIKSELNQEAIRAILDSHGL